MSTVSELRILRADDGPQRAEWTTLLDSAPEVEPFAHPAYLELFSNDLDRPNCAVMPIGEAVVLYPFLRRSLESLPGLPPDLRALSDACAPPHGWGGPWIIGAGDRRESLAHFYSAFSDWARSDGVISSYDTFHPIEEVDPSYPGEVAAKLPIVVRTLDLADEAIWMDYDHKVRSNVKRARKDLTVEFDDEGRDLEAFLDIHQHTMMRREAAPRYRFTRTFFEDIVAGLVGRFVFVHVRHGDEIVSTELDLLSEGCVYSFAGGTRAEAFPLRPNDLLKHELIIWARSRGARSLILGGGVTGEDSLFRYKRSFAPSGTRQLMIGRWVIDRDPYDRLVSLHDQTASGARGDYFPAYRTH